MPATGEGPRPAWVKLAAPPLLLAALLASALPVFGHRSAEFLGWLFLYMVPPAGKESVIPGLVARGYPPWLTIVYIMALDILAGLFVVWNFPRLLRLPKVGPMLERVQAHWKRKLDAEPWLRNLAFTGTTLYIALPLQGSGGIGGAILGRTLGMRPYRVVVSVVAGSALGCLLVTNLSWLLLLALDIGGVYAAMIVVGSAMVAYSLIQHVRRRVRAARGAAA